MAWQTVGAVKSARATLSQAKIAYDDLVLQVELEIQQAYSNLQAGSRNYTKASQRMSKRPTRRCVWRRPGSAWAPVCSWMS